MNSSTTTASGSTIRCIACDHQNAASAKFCAGCGHGLYEPCGECGHPALLDQKFCGSCGKNIGGDVDQKRLQYETWLAKAVDATKSHEYEEALSLLSRVAEVTDHRFKDLAGNAAKAVEKVTKIAGQTRTQVQQRIDAAHQRHDAGDRAGVIDLLKLVPANLMTEEASQLLSRNQTFLEQQAALRIDLQSAIATKDWPLAGGLLEQLLELVPGEKKYESFSEQVAQKLVSRATKLFDRQDYSGASNQLDAVPQFQRDKTYQQQHQRIRNALWMCQQFAPEPYASPTLGKLAVRYSKEVPADTRATKRIEKLSSLLKSGSKNPRIANPSYEGSRASWLGGDVAVFGTPQSIEIDDQRVFRRQPGQFNVAIGMALQGLGLTRVTSFLGVKKGLLSSLKSRPKTKCWGIDVGTAGIRAVCLQKAKTDERPSVVATYHAEFEHPTNRGGADNKEPLIIKSAVEAMLSEIDTTDAGMIVNLASNQIVSRFLRLPPVKEKMVATLIRKEIEQQIPIAIDDLDMVSWTQPGAEGSLLGRPAMIAAAKKTHVQSRLDLMASAGLNTDGLQSDCVALANFAAFEFTDELSTDLENDEKRPSVAIVDAGASATRLVIVSADFIWYWTIDSGNEELTSVLARITKCTKDEAEKLKRNPAALTNPAEMYEPVELKLDQLRGRMQNIYQEACRKEETLDVQHTWCVGGGCQVHSWLRRVLLAADS